MPGIQEAICVFLVCSLVRKTLHVLKKDAFLRNSYVFCTAVAPKTALTGNQIKKKA